MLFAKIKQHYEAVVAVCCFLILFTNVGLPSTSFSVYQPYLVDLPGVGHSGGSIIVSVRTFVSLLAMLVVGRYYDLVDCRIGAFLATLSVSAGFALYSFAGSNLQHAVRRLGANGPGLRLRRHDRLDHADQPLVPSERGHRGRRRRGGARGGSHHHPKCSGGAHRRFRPANRVQAEAALALAIGVTVFALLRNDPRDMSLTPYEEVRRR